MNALRQGIADYLRLRRGLGYKLEIEERHLRRFVKFLADKKATPDHHGTRVGVCD